MIEFASGQSPLKVLLGASLFVAGGPGLGPLLTSTTSGEGAGTVLDSITASCKVRTIGLELVSGVRSSGR